MHPLHSQLLVVAGTTAEHDSVSDLQDQLESVITASGNVGLKVCGALRQFEGVAAKSRRNDAASRIARLQYAATRALYADSLAAHHAALAAVRDQQRDLLHEQIKLSKDRSLIPSRPLRFIAHDRRPRWTTGHSPQCLTLHFNANL